MNDIDVRRTTRNYAEPRSLTRDELIHWAAARKTGGALRSRILLYFAAHADLDTLAIRRTVAQLGLATEAHRSHVQRALRGLEDRGLIETHFIFIKDANGRSWQRPSEYILNPVLTKTAAPAGCQVWDQKPRPLYVTLSQSNGKPCSTRVRVRGESLSKGLER